MKHLFITITIFICLSVAAFGQRESKEVQMRLKSIASAVDVTEAEKKELILSIKKLIDGAKEIRAAKTEHMELELRENSLRYLTEVLIILDDERYEKWQEEVKRKNSGRKAN
jgi:predicted ribonuclease YlaK